MAVIFLIWKRSVPQISMCFYLKVSDIFFFSLKIAAFVRVKEFKRPNKR